MVRKELCYNYLLFYDSMHPEHPKSSSRAKTIGKAERKSGTEHQNGCSSCKPSTSRPHPYGNQTRERSRFNQRVFTDLSRLPHLPLLSTTLASPPSFALRNFSAKKRGKGTLHLQKRFKTPASTDTRNRTSFHAKPCSPLAVLSQFPEPVVAVLVWE